MGDEDLQDVTQDTRVPTDAELIERCLAGDDQAWDRLLRRYGRLIYSVALQAGLNRDDAADVYQLVSMTMLNHLGGLRQVESLPAWIATVARRHALRLIERNRRQGSGEAVADEASAVSLEPSEDAETILASLRDQLLLQEAMERLPERCQKLLALLFDDETDHSYATIAEELGMPIGSVGPTRARCLDRLRKILEEMGF